MEFNKFDVLSAYFLYGMFFHTGQGSKEYAYMGRALNLGFKPGLSFSYASLSDNGKAIYDNLVHSNQRVN